MNATGKRRLLKLADFLETPKLAKLGKRFDMLFWATGAIKHGMPACGSSACAIGWATTIPSFRRAGLRLSEPRSWLASPTPILGRRRNSRAVQAFFGIKSEDVEALFVPNHSQRPKTVARGIRAFVKRRMKEPAQ